MSRRARREAAQAPVATGSSIEVTRGGVVFRVSRHRVQCQRCQAVAAIDGDGPALQGFFEAHAHAPAPAAPASPGGADPRAAVLAALDQLGPDEVEVLFEVAAGLLAGRRVYGELRLDTDRRDHEREVLDEVRDGLAYAAMAAIRRRRKGAS